MGSYAARVSSLFVVSLAAHLAFFVFLGFVPPPAEVLAAKPLEFEVYEPPPLPEIEEEPEPEEQPEPEPEPVKPQLRTERAPAPVEQEPPPQPSEEPPPEGPPAEETPFDFTGVTLTGDGTAGWSTAVGNGQAMRGPVGRPGAKVTGRSAEGTPEGQDTGPRVVAEADLSRRAAPPLSDISAALERFYPAQARQQGVEGFAEMGMRILPDGRVTRIQKKRESYAGFADACRRALEGSRWTPPLDKTGQPVATDVVFTCNFEVDY